MPKTPTEFLKVIFTREERAEFALELARANQKADELDLKKKEVASKIKAEIEENLKDINVLAKKVNDGYEFRDVEVDYIMDSPKAGLKTVFRRDTGERVRECKMSDEDRQMVLDMEEDKAKAAKK